MNFGNVFYKSLYLQEDLHVLSSFFRGWAFSPMETGSGERLQNNFSILLVPQTAESTTAFIQLGTQVCAQITDVHLHFSAELNISRNTTLFSFSLPKQDR